MITETTSRGLAYHFHLEEDGTVKQPKSLIVEPPPDAPPPPDEGMVWVAWEHGPHGWEYPEDIGS